MKRFRHFPSHARLPLISVLLLNTLTYFGTKLLLNQRECLDFGTPIDDMLPLVPLFSIFYVLAYLQWGINYWLHAYYDKESYYQLAVSDLIAKAICLVCFLVIPVTIARPQILGSDLFSRITALIYRIDSPHNLFPSVHCVESWIAYRAARGLGDQAPRWYAPAHLILALLVFASTVLIKQHFLADVLAGIAVVELGWFLSRRLRLWRVFDRSPR